VRNITDFGAFVELEEGIDGLVHISDLTWSKKVKHPKEILKKDQEVEAIVTHIDKANQRLSLSMKDLTPSAWEGFIATHRPGDVVKGKVSRFTNFGVFVELGEGLEGLCHISELSDERVEKPESVAKIGDEMDFKILRIEAKDQKIALSHRAVGKEDEPVVDTRIYSSEAKGGMASLGELAKLNLGVSIEQKTSADAADNKVSPAASEELPESAEESSGETEARPDEAPAGHSEEKSTEQGEAGSVEDMESSPAPDSIGSSINEGAEEPQPVADAASEAVGEAPTEETAAVGSGEASDPDVETADDANAAIQEGTPEEPKKAGDEPLTDND
jgi:small subunit ribosomal protein S1